jgi:hypothetical protein
MSVLRIRINMFLASRRLIHKSEVWILLPSYKNSSKNFDFYYMYFVTLFDFSSLTWILNTDLWCSIVHVFWTAFFFPPPPPPQTSTQNKFWNTCAWSLGSRGGDICSRTLFKKIMKYLQSTVPLWRSSRLNYPCSCICYIEMKPSGENFLNFLCQCRRRMKRTRNIQSRHTAARWPISRLHYSKNNVGQQMTAVLRIRNRDPILCLLKPINPG